MPGLFDINDPRQANTVMQYPGYGMQGPPQSFLNNHQQFAPEQDFYHMQLQMGPPMGKGWIGQNRARGAVDRTRDRSGEIQGKRQENSERPANRGVQRQPVGGSPVKQITTEQGGLARGEAGDGLGIEGMFKAGKGLKKLSGLLGGETAPGLQGPTMPQLQGPTLSGAPLSPASSGSLLQGPTMPQLQGPSMSGAPLGSQFPSSGVVSALDKHGISAAGPVAGSSAPASAAGASGITGSLAATNPFSSLGGTLGVLGGAFNLGMGIADDDPFKMAMGSATIAAAIFFPPALPFLAVGGFLGDMF